MRCWINPTYARSHRRILDALQVRHLSGEECALLAVEYFEEHRDTTLPGEVLFVDLRPAFQKDLADVTPQFYRAERKTVTPPK
jgi:hypothetical protein